MPDAVGITWAPELKGRKSDRPVTDQHGEAETSSEENSLKTPVAVDTMSQSSGYFDQSSSSTTVENHGTGPESHLQTEHVLPVRASTQTSSGSLKAMGERAYATGESLRRALSSRSSHGQMRGRRTSHSKSASSSFPRRSPNSEHPSYPDQSFASLQTQYVRPLQPLRTRSSHPAQNMLYNDMKMDRSPLQTGVWTADNTPMSSPSLLTLPDGVSPSESLHHLQTPKETHVAEVDHDMYTGNKLINNYEVIEEIGRGEHGKVKLGRNITVTPQYPVAIKIVPRFSKVRRLGRLGAPQDKTKKEVAILKKARHPHVVSLLEVIDDPSKNKVYLVLEFVECGEIKWRKQGVREVVNVALRRFDEEKAGLPFSLNDKDIFGVQLARKRKEAHEREDDLRRHGFTSWSLEHNGDDDNMSDVSRTVSRVRDSESISRSSSYEDYGENDLAGTMYGSYTDHQPDRRKFSIAMSAVSHLSSEFNFKEHDEQDEFVPALTQDEARKAFRDTLLGLEFLHYLSIIHRDIKPANLLINKDGRVKISDFGVSYLGRPTSDEDPENKLTEEDASAFEDERGLAKTVGTPAFWAPELCYEDPSIFEDGKTPKITGAIDLWALGITLFCMIYARLPFYYRKDFGLHEAVCNEEVFVPKYRLVPVDFTNEQPTAKTPKSQNCNKRLDFDLMFEEVPDQVRDIIRKLLIKDPAKRMTIAEAKRHPWVVEGMENKAAWLEGPAVKKEEEKARILDPDEKEVSYAVVSRNVISRVVNTAKGLAGSLLGRKDSRKRASSSAASASSSDSVTSPTPSNTSTIGKTVKESRRQSLKPDELVNALKTSRDTEHPLAQSQTASPDTPEQGSYFEDVEKRPPGPDRAISAMSGADSIRTVRAIQRPPIPEIHSDLSQITEPGLRSKVESLWENTSKALNRLASRDRHGRSTSSSRTSSDGGGDDAHGGPSLAISTASAAGNMLTPDALRTVSPVEFPAEERRYSKFSPPASSQEAFDQAQEINRRRFIQEAEASAEAAANTPERQESTDECPPSPDDITYLQKQKELDAGPSASTIASSVDGMGNSSVSQNMSNGSFGMPSNASSPPTEGFLSADFKSLQTTEPDYMRTADTIKERPATATGASLEARAGDDEGDDYESEDEGMMMTASKKK